MGSKKRSFDAKSVGRKFQNTGTEPFLGKKSAEKGKKAEKLRFFRLTRAFLGKKARKGGSGWTFAIASKKSRDFSALSPESSEMC